MRDNSYDRTIESFWSIFKRGIVSSFQEVSRKYMPLYVAEFHSGIIIASTTTFSERLLRVVEFIIFPAFLSLR
jgi:hypothetical protein